MNDLIRRELIRVKEKKKQRSVEVLLRFFRVRYHISMSREVLEKRLAQLH